MRQSKKHNIMDSVNESMKMIISEGIVNEIFKKEKIKYPDNFINKIIEYIKRNYPEVVKIEKDKDSWFSRSSKEFLHIYVDEDDGQPTNLVQHPLEWAIHWDLTDNLLSGLPHPIDIKVTNLNTDTKLRGHTGEGINEENIFKKYARKGFNKLVGQKNVNEKFIEKMVRFIERRWDEVINVTWTYDVWGEIILTVYIDEHDNQLLTQHPLEKEIWGTLRDEWKLSDGKTFLTFKVKVINLNKDTDYSGIKPEINEVFSPLDDRIPNEDIKKFIDRVVKRMVDRTEINLYMEDYDPWKKGSPWFGDFITPQFPNDKKHKFNISWLLKEHFEKNFTFVKYFAPELIEAYGFSTRGELEYFDYFLVLVENIFNLK